LTSTTAAATAIAWLACTFVVLQAATTGARRALVAMSGALLAATLLALARTRFPDPSWLREAALRSDAFAIAALAPALACAAALVADPAVRSAGWARVASAVTAFATAAAGIGALAIGRAGWYWEFVAIVGGGALLLAVGLVGAFDRRLAADPRIAAGAAAVFGGFLTIGGALLLLAWRALA
jgi:hypothetical protein